MSGAAGIGGQKYVLAARKMRILDPDRLGALRPGKLLRPLTNPIRKAGDLLHIQPPEEKGGAWSQVDIIFPTASAAEPEPAPRPGDLRAGSIIPPMPTFPRPGQSIESFKEQAQQRPKTPQPSVEPVRPRLAPNTRLFSRVQEISAPKADEDQPAPPDTLQRQPDPRAPAADQPPAEKSAVSQQPPLPAPEPAGPETRPPAREAAEPVSKPAAAQPPAPQEIRPETKPAAALPLASQTTAPEAKPAAAQPPQSQAARPQAKPAAALPPAPQTPEPETKPAVVLPLAPKATGPEAKPAIDLPLASQTTRPETRPPADLPRPPEPAGLPARPAAEQLPAPPLELDNRPPSDLPAHTTPTVDAAPPPVASPAPEARPVAPAPGPVTEPIPTRAGISPQSRPGLPSAKNDPQVLPAPSDPAPEAAFKTSHPLPRQTQPEPPSMPVARAVEPPTRKSSGPVELPPLKAKPVARAVAKAVRSTPRPVQPPATGSPPALAHTASGADTSPSAATSQPAARSAPLAGARPSTTPPASPPSVQREPLEPEADFDARILATPPIPENRPVEPPLPDSQHPAPPPALSRLALQSPAVQPAQPPEEPFAVIPLPVDAAPPASQPDLPLLRQAVQRKAIAAHIKGQITPPIQPGIARPGSRLPEKPLISAQKYRRTAQPSAPAAINVIARQPDRQGAAESEPLAAQADLLPSFHPAAPVSARSEETVARGAMFFAPAPEMTPVDLALAFQPRPAERAATGPAPAATQPSAQAPTLHEAAAPPASGGQTQNVLQRMWQEHEGLDGGASGSAAASAGAASQPAPDLSRLAEDVFPYVKRLIELESDRLSSRFRS